MPDCHLLAVRELVNSTDLDEELGDEGVDALLGLDGTDEWAHFGRAFERVAAAQRCARA